MGEQGKRAFVMGLVLCEKAQAGLFSLLSLQVCEQWREQIVRRLYDVGFLERRKSVYFRQHCTFARVLTCVFHTKPSIGKPRRMLGPALEHHHGHVIGFFLIAETDVYEAFVDPGSRAWIDECLIHIGLCDQEKADDMAMVVLERWPEHAARLADRWLCMKDTSQDSSEGAVLSKIDRFAALEKAYVIEPSYDLLAPLLAYLQAQQGEQACLRFLTQHQAHHKGSLSLLAHLKRRESIPLDDGAMLRALSIAPSSRGMLSRRFRWASKESEPL